MPRILRRALYRKLRDLPEVRVFRRDFERISGLALDLVDDLGKGDERAHPLPAFCAAIQADGAGRALCARLRNGLLDRAGGGPCAAVCDAGLNELAVPVVIGGIRAGYFLLGGSAPAAPTLVSSNRRRHLLSRAGVEREAAELDRLRSALPVIPPEAIEAYGRLIQLAAQQFALRLTDQLADPRAALPPAIRKACAFIRSHALTSDLRLPDVARHCGMSGGHFSRRFHHATGLTFREYLTQARVEHARSLLLEGSQSITEIAFASGFQSLSQFHRAFRKAHGCSPRALRLESVRPEQR